MFRLFWHDFVGWVGVEMMGVRIRDGWEFEGLSGVRDVIV